MKTKTIYIMVWLLTLCVSARAQQWQMDVELTNGSTVSYIMAKVQDVVYDNHRTIINLRSRSTYMQKIYLNEDIKNISWSVYQGNISPTGEQTYKMDEEHRTVVTPQYSVDFNILCIEGEKTLTVKKTGAPKPFLEDGDGVRRSVTYDFNLDGQHELDGTVEIRLPLRVSTGNVPMAAYYNTTTGEWEPVNGKYDVATGEIVIRANHLSIYSGFEVEGGKSRAAKLKYYWLPALPGRNLKFLADQLIECTYSDNPDKVGLDTWTSQYSDVTQIGLDVGFQALQSLGFGSEMLEDFGKVLGNIGVLASVYQIMRADYNQNDAVVAGQSLKVCLGQTLNWASYYCGNAILSGAMASVALLDFSINKFAERAWSGRKDIYRKAYELYYAKGHPGYRSARDWYNVLWPIMKRKDLTADQIHQMVDEEVTGHVWKFWQDETVVAEYITEAHDNFGFTFGGGLNEGIKAELSNEQRGNLFNGYLVSVFEAIKDHIDQEMYEQCSKQYELYAKQLNKICMLTFTDHGLPLEDGTSRYGRCLVRFKDLPSDLKDRDLWQVKLTDQGYGSIQFRAFAMYDGGVKPNIEVVNEKGEVVLEIELKNLRAGYTRDTGENIIDLNDYGMPEENTSDSYEITMTPAFQHVDFTMGGYQKDGEWMTNVDPDEKDGIYFEDMVQDIVSTMKANKYVNISATGELSRNENGLQFSGTYNKETRTGSGTFRLQTSDYITVLTLDQTEAIFKNWNAYYNWLNDSYSRWGGHNVLQSGDMSHDIGGTFTLQDMGDYYLYRFTGIGSYTLNATALQRAVNIRCFHEQTYSGPLSIETTDIEVKGQATMEYQFRVKK